MASTHAPSEALLYAKEFIKNGRVDDADVAYQILDEVNKEIWYRAPWSWTVAQGTTQTIVVGTTDYSLNTPSSYEYIYRAHLVSAGGMNKPLKIESILPSDSIKTGETLSISYTEGSPGTFRVYPKPPTAITSGTQSIVWFYKKTAPEITSSNYTNAGVHLLPDRWWHVYKAGVLAKALAYADDDRSLQIKVNPKDKTVELGGWYGYFHYLLNEMAFKEPMQYEWDTRIENPGDR